jgi:F-type H+-transporting ATPase subunit epsilon
MSSKTLTLDIVSAEQTVFSGEAKMLVVTGVMGELGIMPGHSPLLTEVKPGQIRITTVDDNQELFYISGGMIEVQPYVVTIMADTVVRAADIDEDAAMQAQEKAQQALAAGDKKIISKDQALTELSEASAMLRVLKDLEKLKK